VPNQNKNGFEIMAERDQARSRQSFKEEIIQKVSKIHGTDPRALALFEYLESNEQ
jgi:hypothetical protein